MTMLNSQEKGSSLSTGVEMSKLVVSQPKKLEHLLEDLKTIEVFTSRVSERTGEDRSQDPGTAGAAAGTRKDNTAVSPRDQAIAAIPTAQQVLQKQLAKHIEQEVGTLRKLARKTAHSGRPGDAFRLNEIYARIRRLNALLAEIFSAALDVLRRLYIRVFIDRQPIL